jgi:FdhD protein
MEDKILKKISYTRVDGELTPADERIIREAALTVFVDGNHFATAMIMAAREKEFVVGHLYIQGFINKAADIVSLEIENSIAQVKLMPGIEKRDLSKTVTSGLKVGSKDVFECVSAILTSPVFSETEAVHSAGLFLDGKETVAVAEDLGRHNALDKVIGAALLENADFSKLVAASTGRQPTEMILKCRSAGIPVVATKGVPTSLAVELAEESGITIVGKVRRNSMIVYSHPERIE